MIKPGIELHWNKEHTKYAILLSPALSGWVVLNVPEVAYDRRIVEFVIENKDKDWWLKGVSPSLSIMDFWKSELCARVGDFLISLGYEDIYIPPIRNVEVVWIDAGRKWRVRDGGEGMDYLEFEDEVDWNCSADAKANSVNAPVEQADDAAKMRKALETIREKCVIYNNDLAEEIDALCGNALLEPAQSESEQQQKPMPAVIDFEKCSRRCVRGKTSSTGCEYLSPDGTCHGVVYPTCPPQYDWCSFNHN